MNWLLTVILALPLVGAIVVALLPKTEETQCRHMGSFIGIPLSTRLMIGRENTVCLVGFRGHHADTVRQTPVFVRSSRKVPHSLSKPFVINGQHLPRSRVANEVENGGGKGFVD